MGENMGTDQETLLMSLKKRMGLFLLLLVILLLGLGIFFIWSKGIFKSYASEPLVKKVEIVDIGDLSFERGDLYNFHEVDLREDGILPVVIHYSDGFIKPLIFSFEKTPFFPFEKAPSEETLKDKTVEDNFPVEEIIKEAKTELLNVCTGGEYHYNCTGNCLNGSCGEARVFQCKEDNSAYEEKQSECREECISYCQSTAVSFTSSSSEEGKTCPYPEECEKEDGGWGVRNCTGTIQSGVCKYDSSGEVSPDCGKCQ